MEHNFHADEISVDLFWGESRSNLLRKDVGMVSENPKVDIFTSQRGDVNALAVVHV
jgi:hypothetical protein